MTSDGEALLRAICEEPQEDTPRLIYADWLEENGQPERAEFIRLQCEAWSLCPQYPTIAEARTRAATLLKEFGDRWYTLLPAISGLEWSSLFTHGFVEAATLFRLRDASAALATVYATTPLRFLVISDLKPRQLQQLLNCHLVSRLSKLRLSTIPGQDAVRMLKAARERFPRTEIDFFDAGAR